MIKTKALIINFNRILLTVNTARWCEAHGLEPIIIDNNSSYRPLIEYYKKDCPYKVIRLDKNYGHTVIWSADILDRLGIGEQYIVTDPDLDFTGIPDDFMQILQGGLNKYPKANKCGFSLDISKLPDGEVRSWEASLWQYPLDEIYFKAPIDTTFALYRADISKYIIEDSIRTNKPYMARHIPWTYRYENIRLLSADEKYYLRTANPQSATLKTNSLKHL
jgi:hypothetical protein